MKTNFIKVGIVAALALATGYTVYNSQKEATLSEIAMENIEALAGGEVSIGPWYCTGDYGTCHRDEQGVIPGERHYF